MHEGIWEDTDPEEDAELDSQELIPYWSQAHIPDTAHEPDVAYHPLFSLGCILAESDPCLNSVNLEHG